MRWSMRLIPTDKVSTGNVETMSAMSKLRNHRDSIREGTAKQRNDKTWEATHFRSGAQKFASQQEQKSMRSREYSDWKMLAGRSSE